MTTKTHDWRSHSYVTAVSAAAGLAVSLAIVGSGGYVTRFLPATEIFIPAAIIGAALSGGLCAGVFGREGWAGNALSLIMAILMTWIGSELGAAIAAPFWRDVAMAGSSFGLGTTTLGLSASEPFVLVTWIMSMASIHIFAKRVKHRARQEARLVQTQ
ncbi:MAG: hypothetical protein ABJL99_17475 [Aliishimia sp.]